MGRMRGSAIATHRFALQIRRSPGLKSFAPAGPVHRRTAAASIAPRKKRTYTVRSDPPGGFRREPELPRELLEARKVVSAEKHVDVGERGGHPARERLVPRVLLQRVEPHDEVREPAEARHLLRDERR